MVQVGEKAPDFTLHDAAGKRVSLSDLRGKKVWLWFFTSPGGNA
jgi:peroxiredoxin